MTKTTVTLLLWAALALPLACKPGVPANSDPAPTKETKQAAVADQPTAAAAVVEDRKPTVAPAVEASEAEGKKGEEIVAQPTEAARQELARFATPELDALKAIEIARGLSPLPGVVKARPVIKEARFEVTFTPPLATPATILEVIKAQVPGASLSGVEVLEGGAGHEGGCGSCPMKSVCGGKH